MVARELSGCYGFLGSCSGVLDSCQSIAMQLLMFFVWLLGSNVVQVFHALVFLQ